MMTHFNDFEHNYLNLTDYELQEIDGGSGVGIAIGIGVSLLLGWGFYNGYQQAARGG